MFALTIDKRLVLTMDASRIISRVQAQGNKVRWQDDKETWGDVERWAYPKQVGRALFEDCDGISLHKAHLLLEAGIPGEAIMMTICRMPDGQGHAVLTVATDKGDLILCNNHALVTTPANMKHEGYRFLYRQRPGKGINEPWDVLA